MLDYFLDQYKATKEDYNKYKSNLRKQSNSLFLVF
ncbi:hypothetical protein CUP0289 [Campylobacter upsaliensis RM3195]|nr:hypothetical protein CUP0289 [Campylobacter upsaliensis RM3195]